MLNEIKKNLKNDNNNEDVKEDDIDINDIDSQKKKDEK